MLIIGLCVFVHSYLYYPSQSFSPNHCCRQNNKIGRFCSLVCTYPSQSFSPNPCCRNYDDNVDNRFVCLCSLISTNPLLIPAAEIQMMMLIIGFCVFVHSSLYYPSQSFSPNHCCRALTNNILLRAFDPFMDFARGLERFLEVKLLHTNQYTCTCYNSNKKIIVHSVTFFSA